MNRPENAAGPTPRDATIASSGAASSSADEPTRVSDSTLHPTPRMAISERPAIEGYELITEIHRGGQGVVFRAFQRSTKREVALKVLLEGAYASETARRRFEREVELAASLRHPNIVTILDSGLSLGRMYFAMEFIEGQRLDQYLRAAQPPIERTLELFEQICSAVNFAHQRGVIHRDLKPSNILVDADGVPHILDFGLAKTLRGDNPDETTVHVLSTTGQVVGTLAYMSPEQAAGSDDVDLRSDVYSLGVIFYESLLGQTPYPVTGPLGEVLNRIAQDDPTRPRSVRISSRFAHAIDDEIETILLKCLEKERSRRYQTAGELGKDIRRYLNGEPIEAKRASGLYMFRKTLRRYRWQAASAGVVLLTIIVFAVTVFFMYRSESVARADAVRLQGLADQKANDLRNALQETAEAQARESAARIEAEKNEKKATAAAADLKRALIRQRIQRGDLSRAQGDLAEARQSYWDAYLDGGDDAAARWVLRRYYLETDEIGALQVWTRRYGPASLSADAAVIAVCDAPHGISLKSTRNGQLLTWLPIPGPVTALSFAADGRVAAGGIGWAQVWEPKEYRVETVAILGDATPTGLHLAAGGAYLVVVTDDRAMTFEGTSGRAIAASGAFAKDILRSDFRADTRLLAVARRMGLELIKFDAAGRQETTRMFAALRARDVRCVTPESLAVLSADVDEIRLDGVSIAETTQMFDLDGQWDSVDLRGEDCVVSASDGRVCIYRGRTKVREMHVVAGGLEQARVIDAGNRLLTLDERGALTTWNLAAGDRSRRRIHPRPAVQWALSASGAAMAFSDSGQRVFARVRDRTIPIQLPNLFNLIPGRKPEPLSLALDGPGETLVAATEDRIFIRPLGRGRAESLRWSNAAAPRIGSITLSDDARLTAVYATSDRQFVFFLRRDWKQVGRPIELEGAVVRAMQFLPRSSRVLAARSNGDLVVLSPSEESGEPQPLLVGEALATLESPAHTFAFDREGQALAAACDDGVVRILSVLDFSEQGLLVIGRPISTVSFNGDGSIVLVRAADGETLLFDRQTQELIARWRTSTPAEASLAAWYGDTDALVVSESDGIFELRSREADEAIERNRVFAIERRVNKFLSESSIAAAREEIRRASFIPTERLIPLKLAFLEQQLRRASAEPDREWLAELAETDSVAVLERIVNAAYEGGRYRLASEWLGRIAAKTGGQVGAFTARTAARCGYLLGEPAKSAELYSSLAARREFASARETAQLHLEWIAALVAADRRAEAAGLLRRFESTRTSDDRALVPTMATEVLGRMIVEDLPDVRLTGAYLALANVLSDQWSAYRDDIEFFLGESARLRGDFRAAADRYQRCLDLARDDWPTPWAQWRLSEVSELVK